MTGKTEKSRCVAVIPARGGSKRIERKNIRPFAGKPMIEYAIRAAAESKLFGQIIVSTDNAEIAEAARLAGADVPFKRPPDLSGDNATTAAALKHALEEIGAAGNFDFACCIYPAVPFLTAEDLASGFELVSSHSADSAFAVAAYDAPIQRAFRYADDGTLKMMQPEYRDASTSDLEDAVHDAGQFYWVRVEKFLQNPVLFTDQSRGIRLPHWRAHDIDTPEDWERAELMYEVLRRQSNG